MTDEILTKMTDDEVTMMAFIKMCQSSLSPDGYERAIETCNELALVRKGLANCGRLVFFNDLDIGV